MPRAWLTIPSARPVDEVNDCTERWRKMGYGVALWRDVPPDGRGEEWCRGEFGLIQELVFGKDEISAFSIKPAGMGTVLFPKCDLLMSGPRYPGYAVACNTLIRAVFAQDTECDWVICAGDDTMPDPNKRADEIAAECAAHFGAEQNRIVQAVRFLEGGESEMATEPQYSTFGVMQPTGDAAFGDSQGPYIERVAGSPFIGREFARRMYGGKGPYWHEYTHMGVDEEIMAVALKYGVFWQRPDLTHFHNHWGRPREGERIGQRERMPAFLAEANSAPHWQRYKAIFSARQDADFPGSEPIA